MVHVIPFRPLTSNGHLTSTVEMCGASSCPVSVASTWRGARYGTETSTELTPEQIAMQKAWLIPKPAPSPMQGDSATATIVAKLNASEEGSFETLTHGYFSFAGNLLTGALPGFLDSSQVPDVSKGLINLQVCSCLEHVHASTALFDERMHSAKTT